MESTVQSRATDSNDDEIHPSPEIEEKQREKNIRTPIDWIGEYMKMVSLQSHQHLTAIEKLSTRQFSLLMSERAREQKDRTQRFEEKKPPHDSHYPISKYDTVVRASLHLKTFREKNCTLELI